MLSLRILENFFKFENFKDRREILEGLFLVTFVPSDEITRRNKNKEETNFLD